MRSCFALLTVWSVVLAAPAPAKGQTLVVALGGGEDRAVRTTARGTREQENGNEIVATETAIARLTGAAREPRPGIDRVGAAALLEQAREREADFDGEGAAELRRQVIEAFDHASRPDAALRHAAGEAALEAAAALREVGGDAAALSQLQIAARRFPDQSLDPRRYAPDVLSLHEKAADAIAAGPRGKLTVTSDRAGEVYIDGGNLGHSRGSLVRSVPVGTYRVWLVDGALSSLPHRVEIAAGGGIELHIDLAFERCVELGEVITLTCEDRWPGDLQRLAARVGASRAVGVPQPGLAATEPERFVDGVLVASPNGNAEAAPVATVEESRSAMPLPRFSPLYLIPCGGGQLAQDRPVFAATYLGLEIGLAVWHIIESVAHAQTITSGHIEREPELRTRRYISGGLLFSLLGATVIEAVIWGQIFGE